ncbi:hypothetical protein ACOMHN_055392 [Nucella lapillus]
MNCRSKGEVHCSIHKVHSDLSDPTFMSVLLSSDMRTSKDPCARSVVTQWSQFWTPQRTDPLQMCTCHPTDRQAFCSDNLPEGVHVLTTMDITRKTDQGSE